LASAAGPPPEIGLQLTTHAVDGLSIRARLRLP
jgi:hypothetical protein